MLARDREREVHAPRRDRELVVEPSLATNTRLGHHDRRRRRAWRPGCYRSPRLPKFGVEPADIILNTEQHACLLLLVRPLLVGTLLVDLGTFEGVVGGVLPRGTRLGVTLVGGLPPRHRLRDRRVLLVLGPGSLPPIDRRLLRVCRIHHGPCRRWLRAAPAAVLWAEPDAAVLFAVLVVHALERPLLVARRSEVAHVARAAVLRGGMRDRHRRAVVRSGGMRVGRHTSSDLIILWVCTLLHRRGVRFASALVLRTEALAAVLLAIRVVDLLDLRLGVARLVPLWGPDVGHSCEADIIRAVRCDGCRGQDLRRDRHRSGRDRQGHIDRRDRQGRDRQFGKIGCLILLRALVAWLLRQDIRGASARGLGAETLAAILLAILIFF
eukprot:scaffold24104_cov61-Phaeocystis_antarctica.AAC.6